MFVPGVNGSIIVNSNAPSGSKLKGAYKNSKKRKMDEGGIDIIPTIKNLDPNFNKPKNTVSPLVKDALNSADFATDVLQLAHYSPYPWMQVAGAVGDVVGAGVDLAQSGVASYEGNNFGAVGNIGMASAPAVVGSQGYTRHRSMVNNAASGRYRPLTPLNATQGANPVIKKGLNWNKAALAANVVEMGQNMGANNHTTMRTPQRDNAQVQFRPNPNMRRMPNGGSVLSMGDYDITTAPKKGDYLLPDINRPGYIDSENGRRTEYKMGVNIDGKETLLPTVVGGKQLTEDEAINRYYKTGLHMGKFNTPQEADHASRLRTARYNMLENPVKFQASQFKDGGKASNDKQMVDGVASILRRVEDKQNRLKLANQLAKQFNREKVNYDLKSFLKKSKVKK
jgi:hypothetical protein